MTETALNIESFGSFIQIERENYVGDDSNKMAFAFDQLDRYLRYLRIIKKRHDVTEKQVDDLFERMKAVGKANEDDPSDDKASEGTAIFAQMRVESELLLLEIESFYHFAYVALQRGAMLVKWYFLEVNKRGIKNFGSHREWTERGPQYCRAKGIVAPDGLFTTLKRCLEEINEPRDHDVVHDFHPRAVYGPMMSEELGNRRFMTQLNPTEKDSQSKLMPVEDAYVLLSDYVGCLVELIVNNRHRGHLRLIEPQR